MLVRFSKSRKSSAALTPTAGGSSAGSPNSAAGRLRDQIPSDFPRIRGIEHRISSSGDSARRATVAYAYMQAAGLVNGHLVSCFAIRNS